MSGSREKARRRASRTAESEYRVLVTGLMRALPECFDERLLPHRFEADDRVLVCARCSRKCPEGSTRCPYCPMHVPRVTAAELVEMVEHRVTVMRDRIGRLEHANECAHDMVEFLGDAAVKAQERVRELETPKPSNADEEC